MRGRCVHKDTAGLHLVFKLFDLVSCGSYVAVERRCVTDTAVTNESVSLVERIVKVLSLVHCKNRGELFVCELFADVNACNLADEDLCVLGSFNSCKLCDPVSRLTNDLCVERAVDYDGFSDLFGLFFI